MNKKGQPELDPFVKPDTTPEEGQFLFQDAKTLLYNENGKVFKVNLTHIRKEGIDAYNLYNQSESIPVEVKIPVSPPVPVTGVDGSVSSNPEEVSKMVSTLIQGMSVALYTTLVGSICSVWLNICYQIMSTGANNLLSKIIELGEKK